MNHFSSSKSMEQLLADVRRQNPDLDPEDAFAVSEWFWQQEAWIADPQNSDNAVYNSPIFLRVRGELNLQALKEALGMLLRRHESLRSVFRYVNQRFTHIVLRPDSVELSIEDQDLTALPLSVRETKAQQLLQEEAILPFDLSLGPPFRARIIRMGKEDHFICLTTHLLVCDDWSTGILLKDLMLSYKALSQAQSAGFEQSSLRYGDFVRELAARRERGDLKANVSFWDAQLSGRDRFEYLKPHRAGEERRLRHALSEQIIFPQELIQSLKVLSQREKVSLFMTLLTAFKWLLQSYSNDCDIAVGSCAANRLRPEVEALVGRFGNDLILRTKFSENSTFRDALMRVREMALNAYSYQEVPFAEVLRQVRRRGNSHLDSVCQIMFIFQNAPKDEEVIPGLSVQKVSIEPQFAKFDMNIWLRLEDGLTVVIEYDSDLFSPETVKQLLDRYLEILTKVLRNPDARLEALQIKEIYQETETPAAVVEPLSSNVISDDIEARLLEVWASAFGHKNLTAKSNFFELGGDSILASRLFPRIEREFGIELPLSTLFTASTIREIALLIRSPKPNIANNHFLVPVQPSGSRPPFFCFHGAGGNILIYRELSRNLGPDQPFYGLQCQGLDGKHPCLTSIEEMASLYLKDIRRVAPHGPYFLGGYCMGGILAFEVGQQLLASGEEVAFLALFDTINWSKLHHPSLPVKLYRQWERLIFHARNFSLLSLSDQAKFLKEKLNVLRLRSDVWRGMIFRNMFNSHLESKPTSSILAEVWEANERATLSYVPKPYPGVVTDFRPVKQYTQYLPGMNWADVALKGQTIVTLNVFPAGMLLAPFVEELASKLKSAMDAARSFSRERKSGEELFSK